jgi:hypothetical protein
VARSIHGNDYNPSSQDFDLEVFLSIGEGKKHGRYYLGDDIIDATSTPSLSPRSEHGARTQAFPYTHG